MSKALINKEIIEWALDRARMPVDSLANKINVKPSAVESWLDGNDLPTFVQAQKLAVALSVPFGYLYLNTPPEENLELPDFRTIGGEYKKLDVNTKSLLSDILYKRDWYKEYREQNGYLPLPFIGKYNLDSSPREVAQDIDSEINGKAGRPKATNYEDYLRRLMSAAELSGVWVMRTGIVGNNTHRPLSVSEFRGLTIADPLVPIVLINGQDSTAAQIFTFAHELAHLWLGQSGVSVVDIGKPDFGTRNRVEQFCNQVAAELLVPEREFRNQWNSLVELTDQVDALAHKFRVSRIVIARRARDLSYITSEMYQSFFLIEQRRWQIAKEKSREKSGGDPYRTIPVRNGKSFTRSVVQEAKRGAILLREAASLLGIKPSKVLEIYERMQA